MNGSLLGWPAKLSFPILGSDPAAELLSPQASTEEPPTLSVTTASTLNQEEAAQHRSNQATGLELLNRALPGQV
jgi:hypothetical protein